MQGGSPHDKFGGFKMFKKIMAGVGALLVCGFLPFIAGTAQANPGDCPQTPWGGFCDGSMGSDGTFQHCESVLGFSNCFRVRPVDTSVDPRGWVPA